MAVSQKFFGKFILNRFNGGLAVNWTSDTIKVALCSSSYTPDQDAHDFFDDVTNEISGTGYTAGGKTITSPTAAYDSSTNVIKLDAADTSWATATFTARYAIVYKDIGTPSTSPLIGYVDFGTNVSSAAGTFLITWDAAGVFTLTPA